MQQMKDKINSVCKHQRMTGHGGKESEAHGVALFSLWNPCTPAPPPGEIVSGTYHI